MSTTVSCPRNPAHSNLILALVFALTLAGAPAPSAPLRAGLAKIDITPGQPVMLAGYESRKELSQGIHDPLSARAVAFESDGTRLVLVSTDNLGFYSGTAEPIRNAILEACGLKPAELFLCAIHTHSAPALTLDASKGHPNNVAYTKLLQGKLVELVKAALDQLEPAQLSLALGASPVGVNRREPAVDNNGKTNIVLGRNTEAPIDREVQILKISRANTNLAGVLFAFATHSTSLGPGNYLVSGDIHGLAEQCIERVLGRNLIAPAFAGASGNIDPWVRVLPEFRTNSGWIPEPVLIATMLGQEVLRASERREPWANEASIASLMATLELPAKQTDDAQPDLQRKKPFNVTVARLGDIAFVGWGGEVFNEIGRTVKSGSPFRRTFIFTHCNGTAGYVPTQSSYAEGGYEIRATSFAPGAGEQLGRDTIRLLNQLKNGP